MTVPKAALVAIGIFVGVILTFGASDLTIIIKEKTQVHKDLVNLIARAASFVSIVVMILLVLKKIPMRPTWSYFVMGVSATYSVLFVAQLVFPNLLEP